MFAASTEVGTLIACVILTIFLILGGKILGKYAYLGYLAIDPSAYDSSIGQDCSKMSGCVDYTGDERAALIRARAEDDGRSTGGVIGGIVGACAIAMASYSLYTKLRQ